MNLFCDEVTEAEVLSYVQGLGVVDEPEQPASEAIPEPVSESIAEQPVETIHEAIAEAVPEATQLEVLERERVYRVNPGFEVLDLLDAGKVTASSGRGGLVEEVAECIAEGESLTAVALRYGVKRGALVMWLRAEPERWVYYQTSLQAYADLLVEEGKEIVDGATEETVAVAKLRTDYRKWMAGRYDKGRFGEDGKGGAVTVGVKFVIGREDVGLL